MCAFKKLSLLLIKTGSEALWDEAQEVMGGVPGGGLLILDFLHENTLGGGKLRILCISDEFTRQSLAIEVGRSFRIERVCGVLEELMNHHDVPDALRMDGRPLVGRRPEFVAVALQGLCYRRGINPAYIEPGKPWQNGFAESFHSRLRDEFLDGEVFLSVREARVRLDSWRHDYNEERLHSSLGYNA